MAERVVVRGGGTEPCEHCPLLERHGHFLSDDGTLGVVVLTGERLDWYLKETQ